MTVSSFHQLQRFTLELKCKYMHFSDKKFRHNALCNIILLLIIFLIKSASSELQCNNIYGFWGTLSIINRETWAKRSRGDMRKKERVISYSLAGIRL